MKICNNCNTENADDVKFCKECGNDIQNNPSETNKKYDLKKCIFIVIASIVALAILVSAYDFIIGADERKARKQLEEMGISQVDKEWYEYSIENILDYQDTLSDLEDELKNNDFESFSEKADVAFQIETCKDNLQNEYDEFKSLYNDLSNRKKDKISDEIKQKYGIDVQTILNK